jgi:hypothetical protein
MAEREYLSGTPQPTAQEREWAKRFAPVLVEMVRKHTGSREEIEAQVGRALCCSAAMMWGSAYWAELCEGVGR